VEGASIDFSLIAVTILSLVTGFLFISQGQSQLEQRGYLEPSITPTLSLMLIGSMFVLNGIGGMIGQQRAADGTLLQFLWMYGLVMVSQLPIIIAYAYLRKRSQSRHILLTSVIAFAVFVPLTQAAAGLLHITFVNLGIEQASVVGHSTLSFFSIEPFGLQVVLLILFVTVGTAVIEEVMYRGLLLPIVASVIGGRSMWKASIATSIIFALMHIGPAQPSAIAGLFFLSLGLCYARVKSGSVLSPILIHALFNAMNIAFVYSMDL